MILEITDADIRGAMCGNRRHCVIANALNRQFLLGGHGCILVDGAGCAFNQDGWRYRWRLPRRALRLLRDFDAIGATAGTAAARAYVEPTSFNLREDGPRTKSPPPASRATKDRINRRRNLLAAENRKLGIKPLRPHKRYAGI
jgi:hypothetical protein